MTMDARPHLLTSGGEVQAFLGCNARHRFEQSNHQAMHTRRSSQPTPGQGGLRLALQRVRLAVFTRGQTIRTLRAETV